MKKITLGVLLVIVLAIGIGIFYVYSNLNEIIKIAIEKYGSQVTQTAVGVDKVDVKLADGSGRINGLTIANPAGYSDKLAFSLGEISTGIDINTISEERIVIDHIDIAAPQVFFEMSDLKKTNLNDLKNNITASSGKQTEAVEQQPETGKKIRLTIRRISFTDGTIQAKVGPLDNKQYQLKLPNLELKNIGGASGAPPAEIARLVLEQLIDQARRAIKEKGIDAEVEKLKARARERVEEEKQKLKAQAEEELEQEKSKLEDKMEDKLKGFLGR